MPARMFEMQREACKNIFSSGCVLLVKICNSVVNMRELALDKSLIVVPTECYRYVQKYLPIIMYCEVCCCLHIK